MPFKLKTKIKPEMKPHGTPERHTVTCQGKLLTWKDNAVTAEVTRRTKRGEIRGFTRSARFRMLKMIATIDWKSNMPVLFLTLTYPDRCGLQEGPQLAKDRSVFWRYVEKYLARKVAAVWRVEWKIRQTGDFEGLWMPHVHMLIMRCPYLHYKWIRWHWRKSLRIWGKPFVWVKAIDEEEQAAIYVAKYQGKVSDDLLEYGSYHNNPSGRQWGVFRRNLVTFFPKREILLPNTDNVSGLRERIKALTKKEDDSDYSSFTVLGDTAEDLNRAILENIRSIEEGMH